MTYSSFGRFRPLGLAAAWLLSACSSKTVSDEDSLNTTQQALNGSLNPQGFLVNKSFSQTTEALRQSDTQAYYTTVRVGSNGVSGGTIASDLSTLSAFKTFYGFGASDYVARYYNRGDLGIGREMHCVDRTALADKQIACYVKNFAAGEGEFTFGQSANVAFKNMNANTPFATVAMVYRRLKAADENRVFFAVYGATESLQNFAALDRHGINFVNGKLDSNGQLGTPGVNFNNHIPSNCLSCHGGGSYSSSTKSQVGALFLPFDLDQFEYENAPGRTRDEQLTAFKRLNEVARKVAAQSTGVAATNVKNQLDGWYNNVTLTTAETETFEGAFNSAFVPDADQTPPAAATGWNTDATSRGVYAAVIRPTCRGCHIAVSSGLSFNTEADFLGIAAFAVNRLCISKMPHALQTLRLFWQSTQPKVLEDYLRAKGKTAEANELASCNPHNILTLDPQHITTVP